MDSVVRPGDTCIITRDVVIGDQIAFKKGEKLTIYRIEPDPQRPQYKYVVLSRYLQKRFRLSDGELSNMSHPVPLTREPEVREGMKKWILIGISILVIVVGAVVLAVMLSGGEEKTPDTAWVVGENGTILTTTDGGKIWRPQKSETEEDLSTVSALDGETVWVGGDNGTILKTTDGGLIWNQQQSNAWEMINRILAVDENTAWAGGYHRYLITTDGGSKWTVSNGYLNEIVAGTVTVYAANAREAWNVCPDGLLIRTKDGGEKWTYRETGMSAESGPSDKILDFFAIDLKTAWVVRMDGAILRTGDGGATWTKQDSGTTDSLWSICAVNGNTAWAVGENGTVLRTTDGGNIWGSLDTKTKYFFMKVHAVNEMTAWVLGRTGRGNNAKNALLKTSDGGKTWETQDTGTDMELSDINAAD